MSEPRSSSEEVDAKMDTTPRDAPGGGDLGALGETALEQPAQEDASSPHQSPSPPQSPSTSPPSSPISLSSPASPSAAPLDGVTDPREIDEAHHTPVDLDAPAEGDVSTLPSALEDVSLSDPPPDTVDLGHSLELERQVELDEQGDLGVEHHSPPPSLPPPTHAPSPGQSPPRISSASSTPPTPPPHSPRTDTPPQPQSLRVPSPPLPHIPAGRESDDSSPPPTPPKDRPSPALALLQTPTMAISPSGSPSPVESLSSRRQQSVEPIIITKPSPESRTAPAEGSPTPSHLSLRADALSPKPQRPTTPDFIASPRFRSMDLKPSNSEDNEDEEEDGEPSGQFENVSLDAAPAPDAASPPPQSATLKDVVDGKPSIPAAIAIQTNGVHSARASIDHSSNASGASTPRRHAPPAHPHPFPIPTSPRHGPVPQVTDVPGQAKAGPSAPPHAALGVKGMSTMDKFLSRTRPQHLPPKNKVEDETHLHEWEQMMAKAREHEAERRKKVEARRIEREKHLLAVTPRWEALLADRNFSVSKIRENPSHRQLWFEGIPTHLRGKAWSLAIGNPLAMHRDAYNGYLRRAHKALENGRFPPDIIEQIESDLTETLPILHVFQPGSPVREELRDIVCAWVVYRSDSGQGYAPYITWLAAMFSLVSPPSQAFLSLVNFLSRPCLHAFYTETRDEIDAFYRVFENLQADMFPRIYANCKNLGLRLPESYFRSVLVEQVPFDAVCRLWDQIVLEGDGYIFRAALAIFGFLEPRLYYPDKDEIASVLEGRNAATAAIAERERERARLRGEKYEEALDGKLSVFGLHEDALFDWLAQDGWKDSRFERLVVRELPD